MIFILLSLQSCVANFIISYDLSSSISVINYENCSTDFKISFNEYDATYSSNLMTIVVSHVVNNALKAIIKLNNDTDLYTFMFLDNGNDELNIYRMFTFLTIYKNDVQIGTTIVSDNNINILTPNISYSINQNEYANCPLPTIWSYYCLIFDVSVIPQNVMTAGIAVTLPWNYPKNHVDILIYLLPILLLLLMLLFCVIGFLFTYMSHKKISNTKKRTLISHLLDYSSDRVITSVDVY
jgi:hypothetical protein